MAENAPGQSVAAQTADILQQIDESLASVGSDKTRVLEATIWLADISTFAEMNSVWDKWVSPGNTPTRATVEAKLASPKYARGNPRHRRSVSNVSDGSAHSRALPSPGVHYCGCPIDLVRCPHDRRSGRIPIAA